MKANPIWEAHPQALSQMKKLSKNESKVFSIGIQFVFAVITFWYLGRLIDESLETKYFQIIGIFFGITGSMIKLIILVKSLDSNHPKKKSEN